MRDFNPTRTEEIMAAAAMAVNILLSPLTRIWYARWGSTAAERQRVLPGDDIVTSPRLVTTRAVTIGAPPSAVWPWLVQLGQERGGLYSYQRLENLAGCRIQNAGSIHPEWQVLAVGDKVRLGPESYPFYIVLTVDTGRTLVLGSAPGEGPAQSSWVFHLEPTGPDRTRLLVRNRTGYEPGLANTLIWRVITDPIFFIMERRMLIGIRDRAEAYSTMPLTT